MSKGHCVGYVRVSTEEQNTEAILGKSGEKSGANHSSSFLVAVAGLGNSGQQDISERDEEILRNEIDPVYGWNIKPSQWGTTAPLLNH